MDDVERGGRMDGLIDEWMDDGRRKELMGSRKRSWSCGKMDAGMEDRQFV